MQTALRLFAAAGDRIELVGGRRIVPDAQLADAVSPRLVFLPSFQLTDPDAFGVRVPAFAAFHAWLRARSGEGVEIGACGASVLHLAAAGLLDGRPCAAGPRLVGPLRRLFPRVQVDTDNVIRRAGPLRTCSRSEEHTSEIQSLMRISYAVFRLE